MGEDVGVIAGVGAARILEGCSGTARTASCGASPRAVLRSEAPPNPRERARHRPFEGAESLPRFSFFFSQPQSRESSASLRSAEAVTCVVLRVGRHVEPQDAAIRGPAGCGLTAGAEQPSSPRAAPRAKARTPSRPAIEGFLGYARFRRMRIFPIVGGTNAITPPTLGGIQRTIRSHEHVTRLTNPRPRHRNPNTRGNPPPNRQPPCRINRHDLLTKPLSSRHSTIERSVGQHNQKLFTTRATKESRLTNRRPHLPRHKLQHLIPNGMPMMVIDALEVIDIDNERAARLRIRV